MSFVLSPMQNEYIRNANKRWNLKVGAVRSGKSFVDIAYMIPYRLREVKDKAGLNVILGVSSGTIETNVLEPMREIYTSSVVGNINSKNVAMVCGVPVYCLGAEKASQVSKLQGKSIKYCYGDEIAKWSPPVWEMLKSRLDKPYSKFDGACNPEYPSHWLKQFIDNPDFSSYVQKYTLFDNPYLSKKFVDNLCKEYKGTVYYNRLVLGEWTLAEGLIYPNFEQAFAEPPEDWRTRAERFVLSIDYGTLNAFAALLWVKVGDVWYAVDGYYYSGRAEQRNKTDQDYVNDMISQFGQYGSEWSRLKVIVDPSAASFIAAMRRTHIFSVTEADNAVKDGIRETAVAIQTDKIKINPSLEFVRREFEGYVWNDDEEPVKENDHAMDSMRYMVKTMKVVKPSLVYKPILTY